MGRAPLALSRLAGALLVAAVLAAPEARASVLSPVIGPVQWDESSDAVARAFDGRAIRLSPPIEFGDSYVDVALRGEMLGGYSFAVYFQMDKATRRLKRIMFERQRHGANPKVFRAVRAALEHDYGPAAARCTADARPANGYQAAVEHLWHTAGTTVRAVYRDTTLEAAEGCVSGMRGACGLTGHIYVLIAPGESGCD